MRRDKVSGVNKIAKRYKARFCLSRASIDSLAAAISCWSARKNGFHNRGDHGEIQAGRQRGILRGGAEEDA